MGDFYLLFHNLLCYLKEYIYLTFIIRNKPKKLFYFSEEKAVRHHPPVACLMTAPQVPFEGRRHSPGDPSMPLWGSLLSILFWYLTLLTSPFSPKCSSEHCPSEHCPNFLSVALGASLTQVWLVALPSTSCVIFVPAPLVWDGTPLPHRGLHRMLKCIWRTCDMADKSFSSQK